MKRSTYRGVLVLLLALALALPSAAKAGDIGTPGWAPPPVEELVAAVRALLAPLAGLWDAGRITIDPDGSPTPAPTAESGDPDGPQEDGRLDIDPNG